MFWIPILAGATIGALTNKDPIKGAIIGGTLGAAGGAAFGAGAAGGAGAGGGGLLGSTAATGATQGATGLIGAGSGATSGAFGAGVGSGVASAPLASVDPMSTVGAFTEGASPIARDALTNEVLASQVPNMGAQAFTQQPSMFDKISPYLNVQNLSGASDVMQKFQPRPQPTPQSGQITRGQAPQGTDVMALLQSIKQPERRRITLL